MHLFLVKATDYVKCVINRNSCQNLAGVSDVRTSSFGYMCNAVWGFQFNGERKQRAKIVDHFMMN